jgi:colanic acid biosynthesis glycosyl transferase WcaI
MRGRFLKPIPYKERSLLAPLPLLLAAYSLHAFLVLWHHLHRDRYPYGAGMYSVAATLLSLARLHGDTGLFWHGLLLSLSMSLEGYRCCHGCPVERAIAAVRGVPKPGPLISCRLEWSSPKPSFGTGRQTLMISDQTGALRATPVPLAANGEFKALNSMRGASLRIFLHDYTGHPPQVHVSRELARRGHRVLYVYANMIETPRGNLARQLDDPPGLDIVGVGIGSVFQKHSYFKRQLQEIKYGHAGARVGAAFAPDIVIASDTPLFPLNSLQRLARRRSAAFVFWMMDVYGLAVRAGLGKRLPILGGWIGRFYIAFEKYLVRRSDHVVVISEGFRDLLDQWGARPERVDTLPLWAPLEDIPVREKDNPWSRKNGLASTVNIIYSGTLGLKHNPEHLVTLAQRLASRSDARVIVISEGLGADFLRGRKELLKLANLQIMPYQPFADLPDVLGSADVLLALLEPEAGVFSVPGKVLSHLCAGRPQVGLIPRENRATRVMNESRGGVAIDTRHPGDFVDAVVHLVESPEERAIMGRHARAYAEREFDIARIGEVFEQMITKPLRAATPVTEV